MKKENKINFNFEERVELKKALEKGYTLEYLSNNTNTTYYAVRKEVKAGLQKEDYLMKLYGMYSPELAIYNHIRKILDDESIEAFVRWFKNGKNN